MTGEVMVWFSPSKYGRLRGSDGRIYFCHVSALRGPRELSAGDRIEFHPVDTDKGPRATAVSVIAAPATPVELPTSG